MSKNLTLLIMAAGMGSRYGGLKQVEPFGPNGEFLLDYSIYDAKKCGFNKVVFIIKEENLDLFKDTVGKRVEGQIDVQYVFQKQDNIPAGFEVPVERGEKPWGTAHAILSAKDVIGEPFAVINADDFYGRDAHEKLAEFLRTNTDENRYAMVGYLMKNSLSENGSVKRGVCEADGDKLINIVESNVEMVDGVMEATPLDGSPKFSLADDALVSMNMFGFMPSLFSYLELRQTEFFNDNKDNLESCEFLIPEEIKNGIKEGKFSMVVLPTTSMWHGVTYPEDKDIVKQAIDSYIKDGIYSEKLF